MMQTMSRQHAVFHWSIARFRAMRVVPQLTLLISMTTATLLCLFTGTSAKADDLCISPHAEWATGHGEWELRLEAGEDEASCNAFFIDGLDNPDYLSRLYKDLRYTIVDDDGSNYEWGLSIKAGDVTFRLIRERSDKIIPAAAFQTTINHLPASEYPVVLLDSEPLFGTHPWKHQDRFSAKSLQRSLTIVPNGLVLAVAEALLDDDISPRLWSEARHDERLGSKSERVLLGHEVGWGELSDQEQRNFLVGQLLDTKYGQFTTIRWEVEMSIRRAPTGGCWVVGNVRDSAVSGDYAFWSDNPTGLQSEDTEQALMSEETAQSALQAIGNLDPTLLKQLGIDPVQAQAAKEAAKAAQEERAPDKIANPPKAALADEFAQFEGHTFLTLQSIRGDDQVDLLGGPSAGIAGDLSTIDLARGMVHILSQFSMTLELAADLDPGSEFAELYRDQPIPVVRAGLGMGGLKFTWPRDGGEGPNLHLHACDDAAPAGDALCGMVTWPKLAQVRFQAGPGAFSCINN